MRKSLESISTELRGIKNILNAMWHSRYKNDETTALSPEAYADEYVSTEECARRLGISDQTIRNWIAMGKNNPEKGWQEGIHYVNVCPDENRKAVIRIPWNMLIASFAKNRDMQREDFWKRSRMYQRTSLTEME